MVNTSVNNYATFSTPGGGTGGNGGMPDFGAHIYWRVRMDYTAVNVNNGAFNVGELQFRSATGVPQQAIGGTAIASSFYVGNGQQFPPQEAFDNSQTAGNGWEEMDKLSDGSGPGDLWYNPRFNPDSPNGFVSGESWLGYHYPTPISVVQVMLGNQQYYENGLPMHFDVQYSDDGSTWTTAWTVNDAFTDSVSQYDLAGYVFTADGTTGPTEPPLQ
jgi:hypothetical protein